MDITKSLDWKEPEVSKFEESLQGIIREAFTSAGSAGQTLKNFLHGTWLGEPLHVVLTDLPIGAWSVALTFDVMESITGKKYFAKAADASIGIGLWGAAGAALTGLTDWQDVDGRPRRIGLFHAALNITATTLFAASLISRRQRSRDTGRTLAALGYAAVAVAARLGGRLVYEQSVGVDRSSGESLPTDFVPVMPEADLPRDKPTRAEHNGVPVLLVRRENRIYAMSGVCSHLGGPLPEGKLDGDSIVCPWHGSTFALKDGCVLNGPAVHPQPCLEVRVRDGQIEVKRSGPVPEDQP